MPPTSPAPLWQALSEGCVLLSWPISWPESEATSTRRVAQLARALESLQPPELLEWVPGLESLALLYDPYRVGFTDLEPLIQRALLLELPRSDAGESHRVPTCYHPSLAPDLLEVADYLGIPVEEFVAQHTACKFEVTLLGFAPGFAYLEGLPPHLHVPRKSSPRVRVPAGSVALGGGQCAVYPLESAGGWQLVGRTPLRLFDLALERPSRFQLGDRVRFEAVSLEVYRELEAAVGLTSSRSAL